MLQNIVKDSFPKGLRFGLFFCYKPYNEQPYQECVERQKDYENKAIMVGIKKTNKPHPLDPSIC